MSQGSTTPGAPVTAVVTGPGQISLFLADPGGGVYTATGGRVGDGSVEGAHSARGGWYGG